MQVPELWAAFNRNGAHATPRFTLHYVGPEEQEHVQCGAAEKNEALSRRTVPDTTHVCGHCKRKHPFPGGF